MPRSLHLLTAFSFLATSASPQIVVPEAEFVGTASEDFEGLPLGANEEAFPSLIGGQHLMAVPGPFNHPFGIGQLDVTWVATNSVTLCTIGDPADFQFMIQTPATYTLGSDEVDFAFSSPVDRFGLELADFGNGGVGASFEVEMYDADLNQIHFEHALNPSPCDWNWHGWRTTGPKINRVRLRALHTTPAPTFLMYDNVDVDCPGCFATIYCSALVNSTGEFASLWVTGSPSVSQNDLVLRAGRVPANKVGIYFFGPSQTSVPFGNGIKCVSGGIKRLPLTTAQGEVLRRDLDLTTGSAAAITSGSTWNFQAWYRDLAGGGSGTNLSTALSVTFQP